MIDRIISFSLGQRLVVMALALALVGWGIIAFLRLPIEAYPELSDVQVQVITLFPGHASEEVEKLVTIPIENELNGTPRLVTQRSTSIFGLSVVTAVFDDGTDDYFARQQVLERLHNADLPPGVTPDLGPLSGSIGEILRYTLSSDTLDLVDLKALEDWVIERSFRQVPGVVDVVSWGGGLKQYQVRLDPAKLKQYDLTPKQVLDALSASNANAGGSYLPIGDYAYMVRGLGLLGSLADIEDVVLTARDGTPVRVKDVGHAVIGHGIRLGILGRDHDDDLVQGIVLMRKGENASEVLDRAKAKLDEIREMLPAGVAIHPYYDRSHLVDTTVHTVEHNLIAGATLVCLILVLFLGDLRSALIVAATIPLSLFFAFGVMDLRGVSANLLSIGAIDFGIIVDGAVVMVENVYRHLAGRRSGDTGLLATVQAAAQEVGAPIFSSVLIIMTVYLPILFFQRVEGKMFRPMALTICFALAGALVLTLTVIPVLCSLFLGHVRQERPNPLLEWARRVYRPRLAWSLDHPRKTLAIALLLLLASFAVAPLLGSEFLPELDEGDIWVRAKLPIGVSLEGADRYVGQMREILLAFPEVRTVVSQLGSPDDGTDPNGPDNVELYVGLKPAGDWKTAHSKDELIDAMTHKLQIFPGVTYNFSQPIKDNVDEAISGVKGELSIKLFGPDIDVLQQKAPEVAQVLAGIAGVHDLDYDHLTGQPQLKISIDREQANRYGISVADVEDAIETATAGKSVSDILEGERRFPLVVKLDEGGLPSLERLENLLVPSPSGARIPLSQLTRIETGSGFAEIRREDNQRVMAVKWSVRDRDMGGMVKEAQAKVAAAVKMPEGYRMVWSGRFADQQRAMRRLELIVPLVLLIIFVLLFSTFNSLPDAALVLLHVPFALIGGILGLLVTGTHFSISAGVGFISLFGVAVLNGVLLVACFNDLVKSGLPLDEAVRRGCELRLRPVLMTGLLAIFGFLPAAFSHAIGAEVQRPLAIVVVGGLVSATLLTLLVLPTAYLWLRGMSPQQEQKGPLPVVARGERGAA
ncbi:MAG TPA: CusA/CzcA family heavy metal efflux RND transporter [Candidatus Bathyarchaeia archaeon]|nr:CusA/CzcA family heavy metal efflux RND transporter [Candidatus Bathyarchaeia archaeon]